MVFPERVISLPAKSTTDRTQAILTAALTAFSRYGFSRTTMDDIALASGVARTALYRNFRSKEDIFRALAHAVHAKAIDLALAELEGPQAFSQRLENALIARDLYLLQIGHTGPHADEIAELYLSLAADISEQSNQTLVLVLTAAIETAMANDAYGLKPAFTSPRAMALILRLALEGVKKEEKSPETFEGLARQLIKAMLH